MSGSPDLENLIRLDRAGFLPAPGETEAAFLERVERIRRVQREFQQKLAADGRAELFDSLAVCPADAVPPQFVADAGDLTDRLYGFRIDYVPGFFLFRGVGLLWGGCMIGDPESGFSVFLIRSAFRERARWLFYDRCELFAHELCHAMRQSLGDSRFEEHFAYQTSPSALRRYLGNCFIRTWDAVLFVLGALLLLAAQALRVFLLPELPIWPFWIAAVLYPAYLICRNQSARNLVGRAAARLRERGVKFPAAVLFRSTAAEIVRLARGADPAEFVDLRWRVIRARFF